MDRIAHITGEQWEFFCERFTGWCWRRRAADGGIIAVSAHAFTTLDEALEDAARCGFTYRTPARSA